MGWKGYIGFILMMVLISAMAVFAVDPPHGNFDCSACHSLHGSSGAGLTNQPDNATLCIVCHSPGNDAESKPFVSGMIAVPGISGTSHSWQASMPAAPTAPNSPYGLVAISELTIAGLQASAQRYDDLGEGITCGVCHDQHAQANDPWDPFASATGGDYGRHLMRIPNDLNQLCEDCHYYRTVGAGHTDVRTCDPNAGDGDRCFKMSHPVVKNLTTDVTDPNAFVGAAPLDANLTAQGNAPRFEGDSDGNPSNNFVFDSAGKSRCMSCHGIHYTDSDSATVDVP